MALQKGWVEKHPDKGPPRSSAGFEWPNTHTVTDAQRMAFRKFFTNQIRTRDMNHRSFARVFMGEKKDDKGYTIPRGGNMVLEYADGGAWPNEERARQLGAFFKTPLEQMLVDDGKPLEPIPLVRPGRATAARRKANGHGSAGKAAAHGSRNGSAPALPILEPAPLPPRPRDAKPAQLHVEALPDAPDYASVTITGTVRYDTAMALVNLVGRDQHALGPRGK